MNESILSPTQSGNLLPARSIAAELAYRDAEIDRLKTALREIEMICEFYKAAKGREALIFEWMKNDKTGDSDYPTTFDCFAADHPEIIST